MFFGTTDKYFRSNLANQTFNKTMKDKDCSNSSYSVGTDTTDGTVSISIKCDDGTMTMYITPDEARHLIKMLELCADRIDSLFNKDKD